MPTTGLTQPNGVPASQSPVGKADLADYATDTPLYATRNDGCPTVDESPRRLDHLLNEVLEMAKCAETEYDASACGEIARIIKALIAAGQNTYVNCAGVAHVDGAAIPSCDEFNALGIRVTALEALNPVVDTEVIAGSSDILVTYLDGTTETLDLPEFSASADGSGLVTFDLNGTTFGPFDIGAHATDTDTFGTSVDNGDGTATITFPDGSTATFPTGAPVIDTDTSGTVVDNGDGTATVTFPDGTTAILGVGPHTIDTDTAGTVVDNGNGSATVTFPDGTTATLAVGSAVIDTNTTYTFVNNPDGSVTATGLDGSTFTSTPHTIDTDTTYTFVNNPDGSITAVGSDGSTFVSTPNTVDTDTFTSWMDNGDGTITLSFADGSTQIVGQGAHTVDTDTFSTVVDNGDGTATITFSNGDTATFPLGPHTVDTNTTYAFVANADGSITVVGSDGTTFTGPANTIDTDTDTFSTLSGNTITFPNGDTLTISGSDTTVSDNGDGTAEVSDPNGDTCNFPTQKLQDNCGQDFAKEQVIKVLRPGDTNVVTAQSGTQSIVNILRTQLAAIPERTTETVLEDTALLTINNPYTCATLRNNIDFGGMAVVRYDTTNINWTGSNADVVSVMEIFNAANNFIFGRRMEYSGGYGNRMQFGERYASESNVITSIAAGGSLTLGGRITFTNFHFGPAPESVPNRLVAVLPIIYYTGHVVY